MKKIITIALSIVFTCGLVHADLGKLTPPSFYQPTLKEKILKRNLVDIRGGLILDLDFTDIPAMGAKTIDKSGHGLYGTIGGGAKRTMGPYPHGNINGIRFDGTDDSITVVGTTGLDITGPVTVSAWIKADTIANYKFIAGTTDAGAATGYGLYYYANLIRFDIDTSRATKSFTVSELKEWHHIIGTYNLQNVQIYIDGKIGTIVPRQAPGTSNGEDFTIGYNPGFGHWDGGIGNVRVYNRAFNSEDVRQLYNYELWRTGLAD